MSNFYKLITLIKEFLNCVFLVCSCTSVHVSLHHWDDENEASSGRRTADSEAKNGPLGQQGGGKTQNVATPHRSVSISVSFQLYTGIPLNGKNHLSGISDFPN